MSTIKVNKIENTATSNGGIAIDASGHVQIDGVQLPNDGTLSNRNLIINGAMQVAQRGTSATGVGNGDTGYNTVDRIKWAESGAPTCEFTISQSTTAPDGFSNSYRLDTTTAQSSIAAADAVYIDHRIEAQNLQQLAYGTSAAKSITISFYVKSTVTGTYAVWLYNQDGGAACTNTYTISSANTWEYKTFTVAGDTSNSINNDNGTGLFVRFVLCAGTDFTSGTASATWASASVTDSNRFVGHTANIANATSDDWAITGVQLEVGEKSSSFEHRSYSDELQRCLRYYNMVAEGSGAPISNMQLYASNNFYGVYRFPVAMRSAPTVDATDASNHFQLFSGGNGDSFDTIFLTNAQTNAVEFRGTSSEGLSGRTAGHAAWARCNNAAAHIALDAEL